LIATRTRYANGKLTRSCSIGRVSNTIQSVQVFLDRCGRSMLKFDFNETVFFNPADRPVDPKVSFDFSSTKRRDRVIQDSFFFFSISSVAAR